MNSGEFVYLIHQSHEDWYTFDEVNGVHATLAGAKKEVTARRRADTNHRGKPGRAKWTRKESVWVYSHTYGIHDSIFIERVKVSP